MGSCLLGTVSFFLLSHGTQQCHASPGHQSQVIKECPLSVLLMLISFLRLRESTRPGHTCSFCGAEGKCRAGARLLALCVCGRAQGQNAPTTLGLWESVRVYPLPLVGQREHAGPGCAS